MDEDVRLRMRPYVRLYRIDSKLFNSQSGTFSIEKESTDLHQESVISAVKVEPQNDSVIDFQARSEAMPIRGETSGWLPTEVQHAPEKSETRQLTAGYMFEYPSMVSASDKTGNVKSESESDPVRQLGRFCTDNQQSSSLVDRELQCTLCNKMFSDASDLSKHKRHAHMGIRSYKYNCEDCDLRFCARFKYLEHRRRYHTFEKPYRCDICNTCFYARAELRLHILKHTAMKPFPCKRCGQIFALEGNLKTHMTECKTKRNASGMSKPFASSGNMDHSKSLHNSEGVSELENNRKDKLTYGNKQITLENSKKCELSESFSLDQNVMLQTSKNDQQMSSVTQQGESLSIECRSTGTSFTVDHIAENGKPAVPTVQHKETGEKHTSDNEENKDMKLTCPICNKTFAHDFSLLRHNRHVHKGIYNDKYNCNECKQQFLRRYKYLEHRRRYHSGEKPYECDICRKRFCGHESLRLHLVRHTGVKPVTCIQCNQLFGQEDNMRTHQKDCETKRNAREVSSKTYASWGSTNCIKNSDWNAEEKSEKRAPSKSVQSANQSIAANFIMKSHESSLQRLHMTPLQGTTQNQHCDATDRDVCDTDIQSCSAEPRKRPNLRLIAKLESRNAPVLVGNATTTSGNGARRRSRANLRCKICNSLFESRSLLIHHKYVHNSKDFQCDVCSKLLTSAAGLRNHKKYVHDKAYDRKYVCDFCGERFYIRNRCMAHVKRCHSGEKPYLCHLCEKSFGSATSLRAHLNSHGGRKPHACTICGKAFAYLSLLKQHLQWHSGEALYSCPICGKNFPNEYALRCHRKSVIPRGCTNCTGLFCTENALKLHKKICQPRSPKLIPMSRVSNSSLYTARRETANVRNPTREAIQEKDSDVASEQSRVEVENNGSHLTQESGRIQAEKENGQIQVETGTDRDPLNETLFSERRIRDSQSVSDQPNANPLRCEYCGKMMSSNSEFSRHQNIRCCSGRLLLCNMARNVDQQLLPSLQENQNDEDQRTRVRDVIREKIMQFVQSSSSLLTARGLQPEGKMPCVCDLCGKLYASGGSLYHHRNSVHLKRYYFKHVCKFCGKRFYKIQIYQAHLNHHTGEKPFECDICKGKFLSKSHLRSHILRHQNLERAVCTTCNKSFSAKQTLKSHVQKTHMGVKLLVYTCDICQKTTRNKEALRAHVRCHTQEKIKFQCERCSKWFFSLDYLKMHLLNTCPAVGRYLCQECSKPFPSKRRLLWHMEQVHKECMLKKTFTCALCDRSFAQRHSMADHIRTHGNEKPFKCSLCPKDFFHLPGLKRHMISHEKQRRFTCTDCSTQFKYSNSLCLHRKKYCHANGTYLCRDCPSKFATKEALESHFAREHVLESSGMPKKKVQRPTEKSYKCDVCFKSFAYKQVLETHMNSHEGKKFKCTNCSKLFSYKNSLWLHMKKFCHNKQVPETHLNSHEGKKFKCENCSKLFSYKNSLWLHMKKFCHNKQVPETRVNSHEGKKFKCENCSKLFSYKNSLWLHMKKFCHNKQVPETRVNSHEGKKFKCESCSKLFSYKNSLWLHMKKFCHGSKTI